MERFGLRAGTAIVTFGGVGVATFMSTVSPIAEVAVLFLAIADGEALGLSARAGRTR